MTSRPDLDGLLERVQFYTLIEMAMLLVGGVAAITLNSPWPALAGIGACFLFSRLVGDRATQSAENIVHEEFDE